MTNNKRYCKFCNEEQVMEGGLSGIWFEANSPKSSWKYMKPGEISHLDCYIENIVLEKLSKQKSNESINESLNDHSSNIIDKSALAHQQHLWEE